jgi:hypothetical protein
MCVSIFTNFNNQPLSNMPRDNYNRKDYSTYVFVLLLLLVATYLILSNLGIIKFL